MIQPSNTPPDGDFVRYIERLTAGKNSVLIHQDSQPGPPADMRAQPAAPRTAVPLAITAEDKALLGSFSGTPLVDHVKWAVGIWLGAQVLGHFLPGTGFLFIPALLAYAGWVVYKANENSSGALFERVRQLADSAAKNAAEEIRKAQEKNQK